MWYACFFFWFQFRSEIHLLVIFLQIRYEFYNNCNFTEVGEPFAEQPYAVAVQQGSHLQVKLTKFLNFHFYKFHVKILQEEISKVILELQKDRYFETLSSKYWNSTLRSLCPTLDDSEGMRVTTRLQVKPLFQFPTPRIMK